MPRAKLSPYPVILHLRATTGFWRMQETYLQEQLPIWLAACASACKIRLPENAALSLLLVSDATMQQINKQWRGKDKPTNVLSFPSAWRRAKFSDGNLGDIVLASPTVQKEARQNNMLLRDALAHLVCHALLHIFGYDHKILAAAHEMEALERQILKKLGHDLPPHLQTKKD